MNELFYRRHPRVYLQACVGSALGGDPAAGEPQHNFQVIAAQCRGAWMRVGAGVGGWQRKSGFGVFLVPTLPKLAGEVRVQFQRTSRTGCDALSGLPRTGWAWVALLRQ